MERTPGSPEMAKIAAPPPRLIQTGHFVEDAEYGLQRPQGIYDWLVIYTVTGNGWFTHNGGRFVTQPHDVVLIEPDAPHGYGTAGTMWNLLWAHFQMPTSWRAWLDWPVVVPGIRRLSVTDAAARERIVGHLTDADRLFQSYMPHRLPLARNALEATILWADQQNPSSAYAQIDPRIRRVLEYVGQHLHEPIRLNQLARVASLSTSRLSHLFRRQMSITPQQFIERQRMDRAADLLRMTSMTVREIADHVGFDSAFYFTARFRNARGISPSVFRKAELAADKRR
ncbi:MAG: helix-turn-helix domain-containing protein [Phycisphaeraceae bacterium]|nr:helix-turn-helix domain-containing protein [Phycisphaeraceae bacterium]